MLYIKIITIFMIVAIASMLGNIKAKKYKFRVDELKLIKESLNIFKTKIKFTYEPIPEIFKEISNLTNGNISNMFRCAFENMKLYNATNSWYMAIENVPTNMNKEDLNLIKSLGNLLGKTDKEGQISEIELVEGFTDAQIKKAEVEREKNEKMYRTLGTIAGVAIAIVLL